jgi:hypothetical protein
MNDNVIPLRAGRPEEIERTCEGQVPDELLGLTCAGSIDPGRIPQEN